LAINPFENLEIYTESKVKLYRRVGEDTSISTNTLPPHVFKIADDAYRCMLYNFKNKNNDKINQSILVSGNVQIITFK
jgi:myosin heavy subunit